MNKKTTMIELGGVNKSAQNQKPVYQFKITLLETRPPIWRRIQVKECTLDKLHEHIQTAMGWMNSHLHHFKIGEQLYGEPRLTQENDQLEYEDSMTTMLSEIIPASGKRFRFVYQYDFGDGWEHEMLFEGCLPPKSYRRYPVCLEGQRACPPEDVGGTGGYDEFLEAIADPDHEQHDQMVRWVGGKFDPEDFDPIAATKAMRKRIARLPLAVARPVPRTYYELRNRARPGTKQVTIVLAEFASSLGYGVGRLHRILQDLKWYGFIDYEHQKDAHANLTITILR